MGAGMPTTIKFKLLLQSPSQLSMSPIDLLFPFIWADYSMRTVISQVFPRFFRLSQRKAVKNFRPRPDCSGRVARYAIAWGGGWGFRQGTTEPSPCPLKHKLMMMNSMSASTTPAMMEDTFTIRFILLYFFTSTTIISSTPYTYFLTNTYLLPSLSWIMYLSPLRLT